MIKFSIFSSISGGVLLFLLIFFFILPPDYDGLNFVHRFFAKRIYDKWDKHISSLHKDERAVVDYDLLMNQLNYFERKFADKIFSINPKELGFNGPFYSRERPTNIIKVESVQLGSGDYKRETGVQYCVSHVHKDYLLLVERMERDIGKKLFIDSGYRSPGRQAFLFFYYLVNSSEYVLKENARWIAMPGFSEHGHPVNHAIDFTSAEGINGFSDGQTADQFESLPEYEWMMNNANHFNFYLSYPEDNLHGVAFEPWHWYWENVNN